MTNTNQHHFESPVFSRQAHPTTEHSLSTVSPASSRERTDILESAGMPRLLTLAADHIGTSRNPARPPSAQTGGWHIHPMRQQATQTTRQESRTTATHTNTVPNTLTSGPTSGRGALANPDTLHTSLPQLQRPLGGVRQDKDRINCDRVSLLQPAAVNKITRSQSTSRKSARTQKGDSDNRRCVPVQVWVSPLVKNELSRIASAEDLSLSAAGAALLTRGLQQNVDMQYGALLRPIIEDAIAKQMAGITTRLTWLLVRIAFDAGQTRSLVTNILGRQQGVTQPLLKTILEGSGRSAKANIMRRTPQISELISSVEQWMLEENRGEKNKNPV